jgi:hypothetical protein
LLAAGDGITLTGEIVVVLREHGDDVLACLLPILRAAGPGPSAPLGELARECERRLTAITERAARADHVWSVPWSGGCGCGLCGTLGGFFADPTQQRELAFLSACQTAAGSVHYVDESIHLAAAMQFLGYRNVIGTMWNIADSPAPHVSDAVYTLLTRYGIPDPSRSAQALHHAVRALRRQDPTNPLQWAPYIRLGP